MTQLQVGILAGMTKSQISRMEHGTLGSEETVSRVLAAMGYEMVVDFKDLRQGSNLDTQKVLSILNVYFQSNKDRYGIEKIGLFGSFARGEQREISDIDILVKLKKPTLFLYSEIAGQLENVFGRHIDIISANSHLKDSFRAQIEKEVIYVS